MAPAAGKSAVKTTTSGFALVRAVFEKHKHHKDWAGTRRAVINGGGRGAENYRKSVGDRVTEAANAEKAGKEYVPHSPNL